MNYFKLALHWRHLTALHLLRRVATKSGHPWPLERAECKKSLLQNRILKNQTKEKVSENRQYSGSR